MYKLWDRKHVTYWLIEIEERFKTKWALIKKMDTCPYYLLEATDLSWNVWTWRMTLNKISVGA